MNDNNAPAPFVESPPLSRNQPLSEPQFSGRQPSAISENDLEKARQLYRLSDLNFKMPDFSSPASSPFSTPSRKKPFIFKDPKAVCRFPGLIITVNKNEVPHPDEFFQLAGPKDDDVKRLQKSFDLEEKRLHMKYFNLLVPLLPASKVAAHIAFLCESGYMNREEFVRVFDVQK